MTSRRRSDRRFPLSRENRADDSPKSLLELRAPRPISFGDAALPPRGSLTSQFFDCETAPRCFSNSRAPQIRRMRQKGECG